MHSSLISRRRAITALAGGLVWPSLGRAQEAAPARRFRAIEVDVSPLRSKGDAATADWIAKDLPALLRASLGARFSPGDRGAPTLRARIDEVQFGVSNGGSPGSGQGMDQIEGAGIVVAGNGRVAASYPLVSSVQVHSGPIDPSGNDARQRLVNLAQSSADWLPGTMGI
jgi:hypothetical protein